MIDTVKWKPISDWYYSCPNCGASRESFARFPIEKVNCEECGHEFKVEI
jgi:rubredoxin